MGNTTSSSSSSSSKHGSARHVVDQVTASIQQSAKKLEQSDLMDHLCGGIMDDDVKHNASSYDDDEDDDYSEEETLFSETDTLDDSSRYPHTSKSETPTKRSKETTKQQQSQQQPLASSFAKRCYFTKAGIGKTTCHYEGLTLTGNVVLMLAQAMKLKGCPTICDEDLRRVEQTYPNQFSRLPDELLLSSGWRRISKHCHFSNQPIPDGIPFFHSVERLHPSGGYYFLLAAAVGMVRPMDVEPLTRDTLVLLETDFGPQCDMVPPQLVHDASQWTLVNRFCFFSGGPINDQEDVYYQAQLDDGNWIYMLAFLSPSLTPQELYKLENSDSVFESVEHVQAVETVYDLTERDFEDLKLYHLGPCRALPPFLLQPGAWTKILPVHFLMAKDEAMRRVHEYQVKQGLVAHQQQQQQGMSMMNGGYNDHPPPQQQSPMMMNGGGGYSQQSPSTKNHQHGYDSSMNGQPPQQESSSPKKFAPVRMDSDSMQEEQPNSFQREVEEEGAFVSVDAPLDEVIASRARLAPEIRSKPLQPPPPPPNASTVDPPEDEPPSLTSPGAATTTTTTTSVYKDGDSKNDVLYEQERPKRHPYDTEDESTAYHSPTPRTPRPEFFDSPDKQAYDKEPSPTEEESFSPEDDHIGDGYAYSNHDEEDFGHDDDDEEQDEFRMQQEESWKEEGSSSWNPQASGSGVYKDDDDDDMAHHHLSIDSGAPSLSLAPDDSATTTTTFSPQQHGTSSTIHGDESSAGDSFISGSSVWTDTNPNSRRALILQMAKARMKSQKATSKPMIVEERDAASFNTATAGDLD